MPIKLDDMQSVKSAKTFSPKYFDSALTGTGKKTGVLNELANPAYMTVRDKTDIYNVLHEHKSRGHNGDTTIRTWPIDPIPYQDWKNGNIAELPAPDIASLYHIGTITDRNGKNPNELYVSVSVQGLMLVETDTHAQGGGISRKLTVCYQLFFYRIKDPTKPCNYATAGPIMLSQTNYNTAASMFTINLQKDFIDTVNLLQQNTACLTLNKNAVDSFIDTISLYDLVCRRSEEWQTTIDKTVGMFLDNIVSAGNSNIGTSKLNRVANMLHLLENYNVPLDMYRNIYNDIRAKFTPADASELCKQNLNLLLSDTLNNLNSNKQQLHHLTKPTTPVSMSLRRYSPEQTNAITSEEPLVLVQSGAGSGKSTVILGRIDYMCAAGVDPEDITVLSFTNAAADHITDKNPRVHSMTIARMVHNIYETNFPNHVLSSVDTIRNSIDIYYPPHLPRDPVVSDFHHLMTALIKGDNDAFTRCNNFIEKHYDEVIEILNTIGQTSLELEIIICYQQIENFKEPASVQSKFLIIDEVQDNSIFEFIYTLKYVDKHKESLFIVGRLQLPTLNPTNCRKLAS